MSAPLSAFFKKKTAVIITGGSSGIGKCFIERLYSIDPNLLFCNLSRSKPEINLPKIRLVHFPCDLSDQEALRSVFPRLQETLASEGGDGGYLLVNNSGFGAYGPFENIDPERQLAMVDLNIRAMVALTGLLLPELNKRGGNIINIASTAAFQPTPYLATYGATKAFVLNWSLSLGNELRDSRVGVLCVCPGPTATNFFRAAGFTESPLPGGVGETPAQVVEATLKALVSGRSLLVSGWSNKIMAFFSGKMPKVLVTWFSGELLRRIRKP